jgi:prolyl-tRNA editing enzyme YbaK/EbsC (Cys-tRNA(Pro) deacylase)
MQSQIFKITTAPSFLHYTKSAADYHASLCPFCRAIALSGAAVAAKIGAAPERLFKTLVTEGKKYYIG